ncbi:hypothetical protein [Terriglobus sp.]|uniref:hypothetical protein n=1 Tax=Terriglobus sp. TaxID=1889013 RepID=UPI003B0010A1
MPQKRTDPTQAGSETAPTAGGFLVRGLFLILLGLGFGYWALVRPVQQAQQTGSAEYSPIALIGVPALIYAGVALIGVTVFGDRSTRSLDANGRPRINATGLIFLVSVLGSMVAMVVWWVHFTHSAGVNAF